MFFLNLCIGLEFVLFIMTRRKQEIRWGSANEIYWLGCTNVVGLHVVGFTSTIPKKDIQIFGKCVCIVGEDWW